MDSDEVFLCAGLVCALGIGAFILWGPSSSRPSRKPGRICGLVNLGNTCFLNTLLQALAACPLIIQWLSHQQMKPDGLASALKMVLQVLNGQHTTITDDPFTPSNIIKSLIRHGWVIAPGEQDAHELYHIIMSTLNEEIQASNSKVLSLSDVFCKPEENGATITRASLKKTKCDTTLLPEMANSIYNSTNAYTEFSLPSLSTLPPFQGLMTSQLQCTSCSYKSAVLYDKFDSLSLSLPSLGERFMQRLTLLQLLEKYVSTEVVKDFVCEGCSQQQNGNSSRKTNALKTLNFGKLPKCLCFHIQRTTWQQNGRPLKRYDHVEFPEFLAMDSYTFAQVQRKKALLSNYCRVTEQTSVGKAMKKPVVPSLRKKHLYRLTAIIVHTGDLENGHFVTYRRAPLREHSWYYTSDTEVRESSLQEAMRACAYMLFYCKNTPQYSSVTSRQ